MAGDWREKVKAAKQRAESTPASGAAEAGASAAAGKPDLATLAAGLPAGWQPMWDAASREVYYGKVATGVRRWTPPPPYVRMTAWLDSVPLYPVSSEQNDADVDGAEPARAPLRRMTAPSRPMPVPWPA